MKTGTFGPKEWDEPTNITSQEWELRRHEANKTKWAKRKERWAKWKNENRKCGCEACMGPGGPIADHDRAAKSRTVSCDSCAVLVINNVVCHEFGCPNKENK